MLFSCFVDCFLINRHHFWLVSIFVEKYSFGRQQLPFLYSSWITITSSLQMYSSLFVRLLLLWLWLLCSITFFFSSLRSIYYAFAQLLSVERIWDNALKLTHKWPGLCWFQLRDSFCWPCLKAYGIFDLYTVYTVQVRTQRASVLTIDKKKYADPAVMFCFVFVSLLSTFSQQHFWLTQLQKRDFQVSHVEKYSFSQWFLVFFLSSFSV